MRIALFGGTFDPIHSAHLQIAREAARQCALDRVWFIFDAQQRLWQEMVDNKTHDPLRHFAIDLVIFDSKITIDSVTCIPLVSLPPATITIPDGPRADESCEIAYNEIPLFGRLTIHDQLEPRQAERVTPDHSWPTPASVAKTQSVKRPVNATTRGDTRRSSAFGR